MGHERTGFLPRSARWQGLLSDIARFAEGDIDIGPIGNRTLENVRQRFESLPEDDGVAAAVTYLLAISRTSRGLTIPENLSRAGLKVSSEWSPLELVGAMAKWVDMNKDSSEYAELAKRAASDALVNWFQAHNSGQGELFQMHSSNSEIWHATGNGGGFSDLARLFLSKFTERYISYFLEREASSAVSSLEQRKRLRAELGSHIDMVSRHAFESTGITQSFFAAWFNKRIERDFPNKVSVRKLLEFAFHKMREELKLQESLQ